MDEKKGCRCRACIRAFTRAMQEDTWRYGRAGHAGAIFMAAGLTRAAPESRDHIHRLVQIARELRELGLQPLP